MPILQAYKPTTHEEAQKVPAALARNDCIDYKEILIKTEQNKPKLENPNQ